MREPLGIMMVKALLRQIKRSLWEKESISLIARAMIAAVGARVGQEIAKRVGKEGLDQRPGTAPRTGEVSNPV